MIFLDESYDIGNFSLIEKYNCYSIDNVFKFESILSLLMISSNARWWVGSISYHASIDSRYDLGILSTIFDW